jgi:Spy/CpxP family protein refolding chaperone
MTAIHRTLAFTLLMACALCAHAKQAAAPTPEEAEALEQLQLLQVQVGPEKRALIEQQLDLRPDQAAKFWPVYDEHQAALAGFNERRLRNIMEYARIWNTDALDDASATALAKEALSIEKDEAEQMERTFKHLKGAVSPMKAVRYLQIESKLRAILRFQQAAEVPLVQ